VKALRLVFGSVVVYLSVATLHACSASPPNLTATASGPGGSGGGAVTSSSGHGGTVAQDSGMGGMSSAGGEMMSTTGDVFDSGIFDALTDPVGNASADPTSGSRLKAYYQTSDDGGKAYMPGAWYDSQRNEDCAFAIAYDGSRRCMPIYLFNYVAGFFDSACKQPIVAENAQGCAGPYVMEYTATGAACSGGYAYKLYPVLTKVVPAMVYHLQGDGTCKGSAPSPTAVYHLTGPAIPPSAFVGGSYQHD
jgi:hypothetical protein